MLLIFFKIIDQRELQLSKRFRSVTNSSDGLIVAKRRAKDGRLFFEKIRALGGWKDGRIQVFKKIFFKNLKWNKFSFAYWVEIRAVESDFKKYNKKSDAQGACRRLYPTTADE